AEDALGGRVERLDHGPLVDGDDAVHGGLDDGAGAGLALVEGVCRARLLLRPRQHDADGAQERPLVLAEVARRAGVGPEEPGRLALGPEADTEAGDDAE